MPRKFIVDYGEEEDEPEPELPGILGLPRYLIPWGGDPTDPTRIGRQHYEGARVPVERELWLVKYKYIRGGESESTSFALGTNNEKLLRGWYWEDTVNMINSSGDRIAILKVLDIIPAPWW